MRKFENVQEEKLALVICNACGKEMRVQDGYLKEGCFSADVTFGYFSRKDGRKHHFDLCEDCYDKMISRFRVPVEEEDNTELL